MPRDGGDVARAVDEVEHALLARLELGRRLRMAALQHHVGRRQLLAEVAELVDAAHAVEEQLLGGELELRDGAVVLVGAIEVERAAAQHEHAEEDLFDLLAHVGVEVVRREQALLDEDLAELRAPPVALTRVLQLLVGDDAEAVEDGAEAILGHVGGGGADVAAAEVDGLARGAVDDGELSRPGAARG